MSGNGDQEYSLYITGSALNVRSITGDEEKGDVESDETFYDAESSALR